MEVFRVAAVPPSATVPAGSHSLQVILITNQSVIFVVPSEEEAQDWVRLIQQRLKMIKAFPDALCEGNLMKKSRQSQWSCRWVVLRNGELSYMKHEKEAPQAASSTDRLSKKEEPKTISLADVIKVTLGSDEGHPFCFVLHTSKTSSEKGRQVLFDCGDFKRAEEWSGMIQGCIRGMKDVLAWGDGTGGQLGIRKWPVGKILTPAKVPGLMDTNVKEIACGTTHNLALMADGKVYSWGQGHDGRLGHGDEIGRDDPCMIAMLESTTVRHVACTDHTSMAWTDTGDLYLWGDVSWLSGCDKQSLWVPRCVARLKGCVWQASLGPNHAAVVTFGGELFTWGLGFTGQLGHGDTADRSAPTQVEIKDLVRGRAFTVSCGVWHTAVLTEYGQVLTWGNGDQYQVGHGDKEMCMSPKVLEGFQVSESAGVEPVCMIACGQTHSIALTAQGDVFVWGRGKEGQLGLGQTVDAAKTPKQVPKLSGVAYVSCGALHSAVITQDGTLFTWGQEGGLGYEAEIYAQREEEEKSKKKKDALIPMEPPKPGFSPKAHGKLLNKVERIAYGNGYGIAVCSKYQRNEKIPDMVPGLVESNPEMTMILESAAELAKAGTITMHEWEEQKRQVFQASVAAWWQAHAGARMSVKAPLHELPRFEHEGANRHVLSQKDDDSSGDGSKAVARSDLEKLRLAANAANPEKAIDDILLSIRTSRGLYYDAEHKKVQDEALSSAQPAPLTRQQSKGLKAKTHMIADLRPAAQPSWILTAEEERRDKYSKEENGERDDSLIPASRLALEQEQHFTALSSLVSSDLFSPTASSPTMGSREETPQMRPIERNSQEDGQIAEIAASSEQPAPNEGPTSGLPRAYVGLQSQTNATAPAEAEQPKHSYDNETSEFPRAYAGMVKTEASAEVETSSAPQEAGEPPSQSDEEVPQVVEEPAKTAPEPEAADETSSTANKESEVPDGHTQEPVPNAEVEPEDATPSSVEGATEEAEQDDEQEIVPGTPATPKKELENAFAAFSQ